MNQQMNQINQMGQMNSRDGGFEEDMYWDRYEGGSRREEKRDKKDKKEKKDKKKKKSEDH